MRTTITICALILWLAGAGVPAETPHVMNFQARLSDEMGNPISDSSRVIVFCIYDDSLGGSVLWSEVQTISTVNGAFTALLGSMNPLTADVFAGAPRYIGIKVGTEPEIRPRTAVGAVPYAFQAGALAASASSVGLTPDTAWVAPYFRIVDGSPTPPAITILSIYNADTTSNLVTLSFYSESGSLIDECSQTIVRGGLWLFKSNQGPCPNLTNHEGYVVVSSAGPVAPAGIYMAGSYGSPTLAPSSGSLVFFKL